MNSRTVLVTDARATRWAGPAGLPAPMRRVELRRLADCPLAAQVRRALRKAVRATRTRVVLEEIVGPFASPTLVVDGRDVTGATPMPGPACRLDLPTDAQIRSALIQSSSREETSPT